MPAAPAVPALGEGTSLVEDMWGFLRSEALAALAKAFGGGPDLLSGSMSTQFSALDKFSERWDSRRGKERDLAATLELDDEQIAITLSAAHAFGMVEPRRPRSRSYDHTFALGGLVRACLGRPAYVGQLVQSGVIETAEMTALGGHRPFSHDELQLAEQLGLGDVAEEYEALDEGTRRAFRLSTPLSTEGQHSELIGGSWSVRTYSSDDGIRIRVAAAPSKEPAQRRANTAETYQWFAEALTAARPGSRFLAVTNAIYTPAQQAAALRMLHLPFGIDVETVGVDPQSLDAGLEQTFGPSQYLQEIRSTIRAYRDLHVVLEGRTA